MMSLRLAVMIFDRTDMRWCDRIALINIYIVQIVWVIATFLRHIFHFVITFYVNLGFRSAFITKTIKWFYKLFKGEKWRAVSHASSYIHVITTSKWPWLCSLAFILWKKTGTYTCDTITFGVHTHSHTQTQNWRKKANRLRIYLFAVMLKKKRSIRPKSIHIIHMLHK